MVEVLWVDEVHEIKRDDGSQSLSIEWLQPDFTGMASASPISIVLGTSGVT